MINAATRLTGIDRVLVCSASLKAADFFKITKATTGK
jgi:triosephosphate isomerase